MNLDEVRRLMREREGAIKAWALTRGGFINLVEALGVRGLAEENCALYGPTPPKCYLFDIPVVFVATGQPEGVII